MNELRLNELHDIELNSKGHINRFFSASSVSERVRQICLCLLKTNEGECFVNGLHGIPWFEKPASRLSSRQSGQAGILGTPSTHLDVVGKILEDKLNALEDVKKVKKIKLKTDGRNLSGRVQIICNNDELTEVDF